VHINQTEMNLNDHQYFINKHPTDVTKTQ